MTFAHWKNNSRFKTYLNQDPEAHRASEASYKAGLRAGRNEGGKPEGGKQEVGGKRDPAAICREIAEFHESSPYEHMGSRYKAMGARECLDAIKETT